MTTLFAVTVLAAAAALGASFLWWMFSGAAAWIEPDDRDEPQPPAGAAGPEGHDD